MFKGGGILNLLQKPKIFGSLIVTFKVYIGLSWITISFFVAIVILQFYKCAHVC